MMGRNGPSEGPQPKEPDMPNSTWAITVLHHDEDCAACLTEARRAISTARATGSTGATSTSDHREGGDVWLGKPGTIVVDHSATVVRAIKLVDTDIDELRDGVRGALITHHGSDSSLAQIMELVR